MEGYTYLIGLAVCGTILFAVGMWASRKHKTANDDVRWVISLSQETGSRIEALAKRAHIGAEEVISRGVALFEVCAECKEEMLKGGGVSGGKVIDEVFNVKGDK